MTTEVIIQHFPGEKYRVTGTGRFAVTAEGDTKSEALAKFQEIAANAAPFIEIETVDIPISRNGSHASVTAPMGNNAAILATIGWGAKYPKEFFDELDAIVEAQRAEENARQVD